MRGCCAEIEAGADYNRLPAMRLHPGKTTQVVYFRSGRRYDLRKPSWQIRVDADAVHRSSPAPLPVRVAVSDSVIDQ